MKSAGNSAPHVDATTIHVASDASASPRKVWSTNRSDDRLCYSVEQAAALLSISRSAILGEIRAGGMKSFRIGRSHRISRNALDAYIALREVGQGARDVDLPGFSRPRIS